MSPADPSGFDSQPLDRRDELLADRAIWGLDEDEQTELDSLANFEDWADDAMAFDLAAAEIAIAPDAGRVADPPEHVRRLLEADAFQHLVEHRGLHLVDLAELADQPDDVVSRASADTDPATAPQRAAQITPRFSVALWAGNLAAGAALVIALILAADEEPASPEQRRVALLNEPEVIRANWQPGGDPSAAGISGDVVWSSARQEGYLRLQGLPHTDADSAYQLWLVDGVRRHPVDGGVFTVDSEAVVVPIRSALEVATVTTFAITREQAAGVVVSEAAVFVAVAKP